MSAFSISLDFELFWGVADSRTVGSYGPNIEGGLSAIPRLLRLFRKYDVRATWATVGMLMCRDFNQWNEIRPKVSPAYVRNECSTYLLADLAQEYPHLFFARGAVLDILDVAGQEVGTHTYSHFYCSEEGASPEQFRADIECANLIGAELGIRYKSIVFPRNQVKAEYLPVLLKAGLKVFRGNPTHKLYTDGHKTPGGSVGRVVRYADSWINLTGNHAKEPMLGDGLVNVAASLFLRPYTKKMNALESLRVHRVKSAMNTAIANDGVFHLWWHPHNFGMNIEQNLATLEKILLHFRYLRDNHGMRSMNMADFAPAETA